MVGVFTQSTNLPRDFIKTQSFDVLRWDFYRIIYTILGQELWSSGYGKRLVF